MSDTSLPQGFQFAGVASGVKTTQGVEDLSLIFSDRDATIAGVYTTNLVCAAPVNVDRERTPTSRGRIVVVNSGNANACTGSQGTADALAMVTAAAESVDVDQSQALVLSTGVIGSFLPMPKILAGIKQAAGQLAGDEAGFLAANRGMLTTDSGPKHGRLSWQGEGREYRMAGLAKGAAMISPQMATMLAVVVSDVALDEETAQQSLRAAVDQSFNCISVEGHTSTNDTVLLVANGAAGGPPLDGAELERFQQQLDQLCLTLAKMIPSDGEGATHLIKIEVQGAASDQDARKVATTVADSNLVKTGIAGCDPNWGRIVSAVGYAGVPLEVTDVSLQLNGMAIFAKGVPLEFDQKVASQSMRDQRETLIELRIGDGPGRCRFWTSDLTVEYVSFNSEYHT